MKILLTVLAVVAVAAAVIKIAPDVVRYVRISTMWCRSCGAHSGLGGGSREGLPQKTRGGTSTSRSARSQIEQASQWAVSDFHRSS